MLQVVATKRQLLSTKATLGVDSVEPQRRRREEKEETLRVDSAAWGRGRGDQLRFELAKALPASAVRHLYKQKETFSGEVPKHFLELALVGNFFELPVHRDSSSQPQLLFSIL